MADKVPVRFVANRYMEDGSPIFDTNMEVLVTRFKSEERGGETGDFYYETALSESFQTETSLNQDAFESDERLTDIFCLEDGKKLPVKDVYNILNRGLEKGDKVLMLRVCRGQQFIILSRIFARGAQSAAKD